MGAKLDPKALDEILVSDEALQLVDAAAKAGAEQARANMPVTTGSERDAVVQGGTREEDGVATSYFGSRSPTWHMVEYGSAKNPPYAPFRRAAEQIGLEFEEEAK